MKAIALEPPGGLENIILADVEPPLLTTGDVLVRVHVAGTTPGELTWPSNWVDRCGHERSPSIPAREFAGEVAALGYGSVGFRVGDRVFGLADSYRNGAAAELVTVEIRSVAAIPERLDFRQAAALPQAGLAAWQGLFEVGQARPGCSVLVLGAGGAVGSMAVQLASQAGLEVTAAGRSGGSSAAAARSLGAQNYVDLRKALPRRFGSFDLIFDTVGGRTFHSTLPALAPAGRVVSVVAPPPSRLDGNGAYFAVQADRAHLELIADRANGGHLRAPIGAVYPLEDGRRAFADKASGMVRGKLLISPMDDRHS